MSYDVIVVGLGPAGATAAYELARAGFSVLGIDSQTHPRYKPCGGGISLKIDKILDPDFHDVVEEVIWGVHFTAWGEEDLFVRSRRPVAYMVMRDRFDNFLVRKAERAGVRIQEGERVIGLRETPEGPIVTTPTQEYRGRYLVGADGAHGLVASYLNNGASCRVRVPAIEVEVPVNQDRLRGISGTVFIEFGSIPYGYGWIFPKEGRLSIGIAGFKGRMECPRRYFSRFVEGQKSLDGVQMTAVTGFTIPVFSRRPLTLSSGRIFLVGDAANLVDPFFGEGIYYAVRSGQLVAHAILKGDPSSYGRAVRREFYSDFRAALFLATVIHTFPRRWYETMQRHPWVVEFYYNVLRGEVSYHTFFWELVRRGRSKIARIARLLAQPLQ